MTAEAMHYIQEKNVDEDVIKTVSSLTRLNLSVKKKEASGMYTIFNKVADDAAIEGEIKGIIKMGRSDRREYYDGMQHFRRRCKNIHGAIRPDWKSYPDRELRSN